MNSCVHIIMYFYYAVKTLGKEVWWKVGPGQMMTPDLKSAVWYLIEPRVCSAT